MGSECTRKLLSFAQSLTTFSPTAKLRTTQLPTVIQASYYQTNAAAFSVYSYNRVIDNLMKSGSLMSALKLFNEMPVRVVTTWNILISGYGRNGFAKQALYTYNQMVNQGIRESSSTFSSVLSICSNAGSYRKGLEVQCRIIVLGFYVNVYIGSALVDLYLHMGVCDIALNLFYDLPERNLATWNLVLRGFCELGQSSELIGMYIGMKLDNVEPNGLTFCYLIRGCCGVNFFDKGKQMHCYVIKSGWLETNLFISNALVDFYSACGCVVDATKSFQVISPEDVISWNSIVYVYAKNGFLNEALEFFQKMQFWNKKPSVRSFLGFLGLASESNNILLGKQIHCCVLKLGFDHESVHVQSALIDMYGKCGEMESSVSVFESVPDRSIECCNSLMTSLLHCGGIEDAAEMFGLMVDEGLGFDEVSLSSALKVSSMLASASLASCTLLHCCSIKSGFESDIAVSCSLIDAYSRSGHVVLSRQVFEKLPSHNVVCSTSIINAYARNGMGIESLEIFEAMIQKGLRPDKVTFLCVLMGCSHSGLVKEGRQVFASMKTCYGIYPERQHYSCMVDLLGRAGLLEEAEDLLMQSPSKGDSVMWSSLLHSCRVHQNEGVGRRVAKMLMELEPEDPAAWLQASNFYSEVGDFGISTEIREVAEARKLRRDTGYSLIEVNGCC